METSKYTIKIPRLEGPKKPAPEKRTKFFYSKPEDLEEKLVSGEALYIPPEELPFFTNDETQDEKISKAFHFLMNEEPRIKITDNSSGQLDKWLADWVPADILQKLCGGIDSWRDKKITKKHPQGKLWGEGSAPVTFSLCGLDITFTLSIKPLGRKKRHDYITQVLVRCSNSRGYLKSYHEFYQFLKIQGEDKEQLESLSERLHKVGLWLPANPSLSAFPREVFQSIKSTKKGYLGKDGIPPIALDLARIHTGLGRFEEYIYGHRESTKSSIITKFDIKSAHPYKVSRLQHPGIGFTQWEYYPKGDSHWKDLSWLWNFDKVGYAWIIVYENAGTTEVSSARYRYERQGKGTIQIFPEGEIPRPQIVGPWQMRAKLLRYGVHFPEHVKIEWGLVGWIRKKFHPFEDGMDYYKTIREKDKPLGKFLDVRISGNFSGAYRTLVDDDSKLGTFVTKTLPLYDELYASAITDWILGINDIMLQMVPYKNLLHSSIDCIYANADLTIPESIIPPEEIGTIKPTKLKEFTSYTDHFTGSDIEDHWKPRLVTLGSHPFLAVPRTDNLALKAYMSDFEDPVKRLNQYKESTKREKKSTLLIPTGTTKRRYSKDRGFDITKDSVPTNPLTVQDFEEELLTSFPFTDEQAIILDEGEENGTPME